MNCDKEKYELDFEWKIEIAVNSLILELYWKKSAVCTHAIQQMMIGETRIGGKTNKLELVIAIHSSCNDGTNVK